MPLYAVENLDDAISVTREFLLPFEAGKWLRLALVTLFVAGGSGGGSVPANGVQSAFGGAPPTSPPAGEGGEVVADFVEANLELILLAVAAMVAVGILLALVASVMEFVFVESLRSGEVHVRSGFRRHLGKGLRLFAFRFVFGLVAAAVVGGLVAVLVAPYLLGLESVSLVALFAVVPLLVVLGVLFTLIYGFTTSFVVPVMLLEDRGVLSAWGRFWATLREEWLQYAVYAVASFVLSLLAGFATAIAVAIPALLLAIPFGLLFALVLFTAGGTVSLVALAVIAVLYGLAVLVVIALVQVPVQSYLRYYALLVLGDTDGELDLVPEQRAAVRTDGEPGTGV